MRQIIVIIIAAITLVSCRQANVFEYTVVFEDKFDGHKDTIVGNTISFSHQNPSQPECELCCDGLRWMIRSNWSQGVGYGNIIHIGYHLNSAPVFFGTEIVDRCKIGFFEKKIYPKHKRNKYSNILYN